MKLRMVFYSAALISFFIVNFVLIGRVHGRTLLEQRPRLAHTLLKGQVYDCVDFYQQPAFSHPSLNDHIPKVNLTTSIQGTFNAIKGGCPDGTVPILGAGEEPPPKHIQPKEQCIAVVRTNTNKKFYGSNALLSINRPKAQGIQWSSARIKLMNGDDSIEAGWMVNPLIFKDDEAHLYAKFKSTSSGCLNTDCAGFVQVSKDLPLGTMPDHYSDLGGQQYMWNLSIDKHEDDGNWWLSMIWSTGTIQIGYWSKGLFTTLQDAAIKVEWGGEIDDPNAVEPAPMMGNGFQADYDQQKSAFFQQITVVDENFNHVNPDGTDKIYNCQELYTSLDWGYQGSDSGRIIFYGGITSPTPIAPVLHKKHGRSGVSGFVI